jgi:hypothetical protein
VHAIWFSIIVPSLVATAWIWAKLRVPKVWVGLLIVALLATAIWLSRDLYHFVEERGSSKYVWNRFLYVLFSETNKPAIQIIVGTFLAALFSWRFAKPADSKPEMHSTVDTTPKSCAKVDGLSE